MNSRIYENADGEPAIDRILDDAEARAAILAQDRACIAERRRTLVEPRYKTVVANPSEVHHKIALGAVMATIGLSAIDADALAGVMATIADQVMADMDDLIDADPFASFGKLLVTMIDRHDRSLTARGLYESWLRRLAIYIEDRAEWLARDAEFRLGGAWRLLDMTRGQRWLIRVTCRIRRVDLPGDLSRGEAADWLDENGANMNYREFVS